MKKIWDDTKYSKLKGLVNDLKVSDLRLILSAKNTGCWLTVLDNMVTGTLLAVTEFCDFLCAR